MPSSLVAAACGHFAWSRAQQADKPAEVATRGQREAKDITYGDWQKLCFKPGGAPMLCRTSITGKFPTGQMAVRVDLIEREGAALRGCSFSSPSACICNSRPS